MKISLILCKLGLHDAQRAAHMNEHFAYCYRCHRYGEMDENGNIFRLISTKIYCPECRLELMTSKAQIYGVDADRANYICPRCHLQSNWLFGAPVPILLKVLH